ncbi:MAG: cell division protein FtsQ/DivIB [Burkholderiaceae bacterium]
MNPWHDARALGRITAGLAGVVLVCLVSAFAAWAMGRPVFDLRAVVIEPIGERPLRYVAEGPLEQALRATVKGSFFSTELEAVRERVETVPWVRHASVRRIWPDRLEVRIEEHRALALWHDGRLVNTYRELFSANLDEAEEDGSLPQLSGPPGSEAEVVERFLAASRLVEPLERTPVSVSMSARRAWRMQLDDGTVLLLGRERSKSIDSRIARWVDAYPITTERLGHRAGVIDMRYPNGFAIRALAQIETGDGEEQSNPSSADAGARARPGAPKSRE